MPIWIVDNALLPLVPGAGCGNRANREAGAAAHFCVLLKQEDGCAFRFRENRCRETGTAAANHDYVGIRLCLYHLNSPADFCLVQAGPAVKSIPDSSEMRREAPPDLKPPSTAIRSEEHTSELQSLMRISYAVFCLKKQTQKLDMHYQSCKT